MLHFRGLGLTPVGVRLKDSDIGVTVDREAISGGYPPCAAGLAWESTGWRPPRASASVQPGPPFASVYYGQNIHGGALATQHFSRIHVSDSQTDVADIAIRSKILAGDEDSSVEEGMVPFRLEGITTTPAAGPLRRASNCHDSMKIQRLTVTR
jgi:hypothetical protein